jgi:hypothetical protein
VELGQQWQCGHGKHNRPGAARADASQIAQRMGIGNFTAYTAATDPNHLLGRQHEYTSKINWEGGSIEVFPNAAYAKGRETYVQAFTCPFGDGCDYLDGTRPAAPRLRADSGPGAG